MNTYYNTSRFNLAQRVVAAFTLVAFIAGMITFPGQAQAQVTPNLPVPGAMVTQSPGYIPTVLKGLTVHPDNPFQFEFFVDTGDADLRDEALRVETNKLIKYFLASLTVPEKDLWVNLSPYEKERIIPEGFGQTEMGRDMLAQDYILKQLTASLMYPEEELGKQFWDKVYAKIRDKFGTTNIPVDTFNKVWIIPEKAGIYVRGNSAFVVETHLKVMLEEDYLTVSGERIADSEEDHAQVDIKLSNMTADIVKEVIIPAIENEVNEGENFANLRQIYHSLILAAWYKKNLKESILGQIYIDQNKTRGVDVADKDAAQKIYQQYLAAFKKGVYDYIKEDYDPESQEIIERKYFSGGVAANEIDAAMDASMGSGRFRVDGRLIEASAKIKRYDPEASPAAAGDDPDAAQGSKSTLRNLAAAAVLAGTAILPTHHGDIQRPDYAPIERVKASDVYDVWTKDSFYSVVRKSNYPKNAEELVRAMRTLLFTIDPTNQYPQDWRSTAIVHFSTIFNLSTQTKSYGYLNFTNLSEEHRQKIIDEFVRVAERTWFYYENNPDQYVHSSFDPIEFILYRARDLVTLTGPEIFSEQFLGSLGEKTRMEDDLLGLPYAGALIEFLIKARMEKDINILMAKYFHSDYITPLESIWNFTKVVKTALSIESEFGDGDIRQKAVDFLGSTKVFVKMAQFIRQNGFYETTHWLFDRLVGRNTDIAIERFFNVSQVGSISDESLNISIAITSAIWSVELTDEQAGKIIRFYQALMVLYSYSDLDKIFRIYDAFSSANVEWTKALDPQAVRILGEGFSRLPNAFTLDSFVEYAQFYELYARLQKLRGVEIPEVEARFASIKEKGIEKSFAEALDMKSIREFSLAASFFDRFFGRQDLMQYMFRRWGPQFLDFTDFESVEEARWTVNEIRASLGDQLVMSSAIAFTSKEFNGELNPDNILEKARVAQSFYEPENIFNDDIKGFYTLISNFMLGRVADYLGENSEEVAAEVDQEKLAELVNWLLKEGFISQEDGRLQKITQHVRGLNLSYLTHKATAKLQGVIARDDLEIDPDDYSLLQSTQYRAEEGIRVLELKERGDDQVAAYVIKVDPQRNGRAELSADVGRQRGGITGESLTEEIGAEGRLIVDFPLSFTTGNAKPTEIVIEDGEFENYLISVRGKDALVIVYQDKTLHIADKRDLWVHDINPQVSPEDDRQLFITRDMDDYVEFIELSKKYRISLVSNMLLYDGEEMAQLKDGPDQRRFVIEFEDGTFGMMNPMTNLSTNDAVRLAIAAGAKKVVYADTGQFDYTTFRPLGSEPVVWGHSDQRESSNRLGIYVKKPTILDVYGKELVLRVVEEVKRRSELKGDFNSQRFTDLISTGLPFKAAYRRSFSYTYDDFKFEEGLRALESEYREDIEKKDIYETVVDFLGRLDVWYEGMEDDLEASPAAIGDASSVSKPVSVERARAFAERLSEMYSFLMPERGYDQQRFIETVVFIFEALTDPSDENMDLLKEDGSLSRWVEEIKVEFGGMLDFDFWHTGTEENPVDVIFTGDHEAVMVIGDPLSGKGSLIKALADLDGEEQVAVGSEDLSLIFSVGGHVFAATQELNGDLRARAFNGDDGVPVRMRPGVGRIKAVVDMDRNRPDLIDQFRVVESEDTTIQRADFHEDTIEDWGGKYRQITLVKPIKRFEVLQGLKSPEGFRELASELYPQLVETDAAVVSGLSKETFERLVSELEEDPWGFVRKIARAVGKEIVDDGVMATSKFNTRSHLSHILSDERMELDPYRDVDVEFTDGDNLDFRLKKGMNVWYIFFGSPPEADIIAENIRKILMAFEINEGVVRGLPGNKNVPVKEDDKGLDAALAANRRTFLRLLGVAAGEAFLLCSGATGCRTIGEGDLGLEGRIPVLPVDRNKSGITIEDLIELAYQNGIHFNMYTDKPRWDQFLERQQLHPNVMAFYYPSNAEELPVIHIYVGLESRTNSLLQIMAHEITHALIDIKGREDLADMFDGVKEVVLRSATPEAAGLLSKIEYELTYNYRNESKILQGYKKEKESIVREHIGTPESLERALEEALEKAVEKLRVMTRGEGPGQSIIDGMRDNIDKEIEAARNFPDRVADEFFSWVYGLQIMDPDIRQTVVANVSEAYKELYELVDAFLGEVLKSNALIARFNQIYSLFGLPEMQLLKAETARVNSLLAETSEDLIRPITSVDVPDGSVHIKLHKHPDPGFLNAMWDKVRRSRFNVRDVNSFLGAGRQILEEYRHNLAEIREFISDPGNNVTALGYEETQKILEQQRTANVRMLKDIAGLLEKMNYPNADETADDLLLLMNGPLVYLMIQGELAKDGIDVVGLEDGQRHAEGLGLESRRARYVQEFHALADRIGLPYELRIRWFNVLNREMATQREALSLSEKAELAGMLGARMRPVTVKLVQLASAIRASNDIRNLYIARNAIAHQEKKKGNLLAVLGAHHGGVIDIIATQRTSSNVERVIQERFGQDEDVSPASPLAGDPATVGTESTFGRFAKLSAMALAAAQLLPAGTSAEEWDLLHVRSRKQVYQLTPGELTQELAPYIRMIGTLQIDEIESALVFGDSKSVLDGLFAVLEKEDNFVEQAAALEAISLVGGNLGIAEEDLRRATILRLERIAEDRRVDKLIRTQAGYEADYLQSGERFIEVEKSDLDNEIPSWMLAVDFVLTKLGVYENTLSEEHEEAVERIRSSYKYKGGASSLIAVEYRDPLMKMVKGLGISYTSFLRVLEGLAFAESTDRPDVVSYANAVGLVQVKPATFNYVAGKFDLHYRAPEDIKNRTANVTVGAFYLAYLMQQSQGSGNARVAMLATDLLDELAAIGIRDYPVQLMVVEGLLRYNFGPGNVNRQRPLTHQAEEYPAKVLENAERITTSEESDNREEAPDSASAPGGIDFTSERLELNIQGDAVEIDAPLHEMIIPSGPIEGFVPVIIDMTPVTNVPLLLGGHADPDEPLDTFPDEIPAEAKFMNRKDHLSLLK